MEEMEGLKRFDTYEPVAADRVPHDEDIYDCLLILHRKRGKDNKVDRFKARIAACGNQMNATEIFSNGTVRTSAPTIRHSSYKTCEAVAVQLEMECQQFDVSSAYLQGDAVFIGRNVYVRFPYGCRSYDERGVEIVMLLKRGLSMARLTLAVSGITLSHTG